MLGLKNNTGFTFLEIMVAFSIMAIVLISIYKLHSGTIFMDSRTRFNSIAAHLANHKMAEVTAGGNIPSDNQGNFQDSHPEYRWQLVVSDVASEALGETTKRLKQIDIEIFADNQENRFQLRTFHLFNQEG
ncbi:MAG: prepilin-type N-terminal cleavage/methylation domain-containing protein [Deltaproteobacteria bacterium]|nr:prepilin-type N-terminal cleavage/methylation domain-containing protein [Deltaproteobacteria bacterium]